MASFQNMVITTAGLELLQDLILEGGTPLTFSGVGVGDGLLEDSDITARTSLVHEVHRLPIEKIEKQEGGHIRVFARLATDIITTDFYHRELGVFARHGEQEILFAYGNAGDDYDFIPATGNNASICKTIVTEFSVGSMKAVFLPLDAKDFVTHEAMNAQVEEVIIRETRKVMEALPQVDAGGNMTLAGGLTTSAALNANGGVNIPVAPATPTHAARLVDVQRSVLASVVHYYPAKALMASTLGTVRDDLRGLGFAAPGSPGRGISAASYQSETSCSYQDLAAVTRITLTRSHWGSTMICLSRSGDISDDTSEPLLSPQAITQFAFNENDPNNVYTIYDSTGGVIIQGTLPRSICDHNIVADFYIVAWHDWIYFYQGSAWANRENKAPGNSFQPPLYLGRAPLTIGPLYSWYLICAKGGNGHQWGQVPAGVLQRIDEFRMDQAGMFFPNLND